MWGLDFARSDGVGGFVRLRVWPARAISWYWAYIVGPDTGLVVVRDHEVTPPRRPDVLEVRAEGLWAELVCEAPFEHWGFAVEAFGLRLDEPPDPPGATAWSDEIGERVPVGLDLEWEVHAPARGEVDGYDHVGVVHGELLVADTRVAFEGAGRRVHRWGDVSSWLVPGRTDMWCATPDGATVDGAAGEALARVTVPLDDARPEARLHRLLRRCGPGAGWSDEIRA
jgi:hypothetical protein